MRRLTWTVILTALYCGVLDSAHPLDVVIGAAVSLGVIALVGLPIEGNPGAPSIGRRLMALPRWQAAVVWDVLVGTWNVTKAVLARRPADNGGIVEIPVDGRSESAVVVAALTLTLSPGEVFVDHDPERAVMLIHVLDARDPEAVRAHHREFYERHQKPVIP
jgi:multicomponent Na+:H+ antiporter subunit E